MPTLLRLTLILMGLALAVPAAAQTPYPVINEVARNVSGKLLINAGCLLGNTPRVGIWPLKSDDLPIEDDSAVAFYEEVFAALNATKPDCVRFVDGASGGDTIQYFMMVGDGANARARVDEAFRGVEFILNLDIFDRGGRILADVKLTNANAGTVAAPPAFEVPQDFIQTACGVGAIPLDRALRVGARRMLEKVPDLAAIVDQGGTFGYSDARPSFTSYFADRMVQALEEQAADTLTGRSVRRAGENELGEDGVYAFSFRYLPCDDGAAAEINTSLRAGDGTTASWRGDVRLDRVPGFLDLFPDGNRTESGRDPAVVEAPKEPEQDVETALAGTPEASPETVQEAALEKESGTAAEPEPRDGAETTEEPKPRNEAETTQEPKPRDGTETPPDPKPRDDAGTAQEPKPRGEDGAEQEPEPRDAVETPLQPEPGDVVETPLPPETPTPPEPAGVYDLSFSPPLAYVGDVVSIVADVDTGCSPFFLDLTSAGTHVAAIPVWDDFAVEPRPGGGLRFRIDQTTDIGYKITPADAKGVHFVGFICTPDGNAPQLDVLREILAELNAGALRQTDQVDAPIYVFERYEIR